MNLFLEAVCVGILVLVIGSLVGYLLSFSTQSQRQLPKECKNWNKYYIMEISLFLTGFIAHLVLEATGLNKWYCRYGKACRK